MDRRFEVPTGNQKSRFGSKEEFERSLDHEVTQNLLRAGVLHQNGIRARLCLYIVGRRGKKRKYRVLKTLW